MKTDMYTKGILTIIAIALCTIAIQNMNFVNPARAENKNLLSDEINVNIAHIGGSSVNSSLPVNLKEIGGSSFYGSMPVNLKEVNGYSINANGIPVNIESLNGSSIYDALPVKNK